MASIGIKCVGYNHVDHQKLSSCTNRNVGVVTVARSSMAVKGKCNRGKVSMSMETAPFKKDSVIEFYSNNKKKGFNDKTVVYEKMDRWMRDSVSEIVKNLREAPLLIQVHTNGGVATVEKAEEEEWPEMVRKWESGEAPLPEGVIFVEQLNDGDEALEEKEGGGVTRAWGVIVQGQGVDCGPICYLLKTSSVCSGGVGGGGRGGSGGCMGLCSTHFCLVRVNGFRDTARNQLTNCWLLQSQQ